MTIPDPLSSEQVASQNGRAPVERLGVYDTLTRRLHEEGIPYCHWKSNEHLGAAMQGLTDLDVLVDYRSSARLEAVLSEAGFKRFTAVAHRSYSGIEDYFGLDAATGALVHLHLHYQLTLGEKNLKGYLFPWAHLMLSSRVYNKDYNIYTADPNLELILLLVRAMLKIRLRDGLIALTGRPYFRGGLRREFDWLQQRADASRVAKLSEELLGREASEVILGILTGQPNVQGLFRLRKAMRPILKTYRSYQPLVAVGQAWYREAKVAFCALSRKYLHAVIPARRTSPRGGMVIAFLGSDGSGKSTMSSESVRWLSRKLDVLPVYMGRGDGLDRVIRNALKIAKHIARAFIGRRKSSQVAGENGAKPNPGAPAGRKSNRETLAWGLYALAVSFEKRRKLKRARKARNAGFIVICDRYPQSRVLGFNDGPLLKQWKNAASGLYQWLKAWESAPYEMTVLNPPDLVIKLQASPPTAFARRPETTIETLERKINAVRTLQFPSSTSVVTIDADQPLHDVVLAVKRAIWEHI